jgi:hypothetical protein
MMTDETLWRTGQYMTILACVAVLGVCFLKGCGIAGPLVAPGAICIEVVMTNSPVTVLAE